jgi:hypothetical protein
MYFWIWICSFDTLFVYSPFEDHALVGIYQRIVDPWINFLKFTRCAWSLWDYGKLDVTLIMTLCKIFLAFVLGRKKFPFLCYIPKNFDFGSCLIEMIASNWTQFAFAVETLTVSWQNEDEDVVIGSWATLIILSNNNNNNFLSIVSQTSMPR